MTKSQLLADYLNVTPDKFPGLFSITWDDNDRFYEKPRHTLAPHLPGDPDLPRDVQAAWLLAMVEGGCLADKMSARLTHGFQWEFAQLWKECDQ